jgi:hypothetical protein
VRRIAEKSIGVLSFGRLLKISGHASARFASFESIWSDQLFGGCFVLKPLMHFYLYDFFLAFL